MMLRISPLLVMTAMGVGVIGSSSCLAQTQHDGERSDAVREDDALRDGDSSETAAEKPDRSPRAFMFLPEKIENAVLYSDGSAIKTEWEMLWRPMCNSAPDAMSQAQLRAAMETHQAKFAKIDQIDEDDAGGIAGGGLNVTFVVDGSVPADAVEALDAVEAYLESKFFDPITIKINVSFDSLPFGVLGATGTPYAKTSWNNARNSLQDDMDDTDKIQDYLPSSSTLEVRYNGNSNTKTDETRVFWTRANFRACVGSISGTVGELTFSDNIGWDYDPTNGTTGYSFQDVVIHELGHVMGFTSGADFRTNDLEALDIFRFQRNGGGHDYNPDTKSEFKKRPRLVDLNKPEDQHICDTITQESRMSDGDPYQAGHFREQSTNIGLMDPALGANLSYFPNFFSTPDLRFLDAIGWDR
jgi:hypothetical protein